MLWYIKALFLHQFCIHTLSARSISTPSKNKNLARSTLPFDAATYKGVCPNYTETFKHCKRRKIYINFTISVCRFRFLVKEFYMRYIHCFLDEYPLLLISANRRAHHGPLQPQHARGSVHPIYDINTLHTMLRYI